jgi:hypothetical protein
VSWVRFDDASGGNAKFLRAGLAAEGLHKRAVCWSNAQLSDGFVPAEWVQQQTFNLKSRERVALIDAMLREGLFEPVPGGYRIHDYLDYQPSRAEVEAKRRKGNERVTRYRERQRNALQTSDLAGARALPTQPKENNNNNIPRDEAPAKGAFHELPKIKGVA